MLGRAGIALACLALLAIGVIAFAAVALRSPLRTSIRQPAVDRPLELQFDRPLTIESVVLTNREGDLIDANERWDDHNRLTVTPAQPLAYATEYEVSLRGIQDIRGRGLADISRRFTTAPARFLYRSPNGRLMLHSLGASDLRRLSLAGDSVTDYAVSADGRLAVYVTANRLVALELGSGNSAPTYRVTGLEPGVSYGNPQLCDNGGWLVANEVRSSGGGKFLISAAVRVPIRNGRPDPAGRRVLLEAVQAPDTASVFCDPLSDRITFLNADGKAVVATLAEPSGQSLTDASRVYGLTPRTGGISLGTVTEGASVSRSVALAQGAAPSTMISEPDRDAADPAYFFDESTVALAESAVRLDDKGVPASEAGIVLYRRFPEGTVRDPLPEPEIGLTDQKPAWSRDGRLLSFERAQSSRARRTDRPRTLDGSFTDGTIWTVQPNCLSTGASVCVPGSLRPTSTGIAGSRVTWLP